MRFTETFVSMSADEIGWEDYSRLIFLVERFPPTKTRLKSSLL